MREHVEKVIVFYNADIYWLDLKHISLHANAFMRSALASSWITGKLHSK